MLTKKLFSLSIFMLVLFGILLLYLPIVSMIGSSFVFDDGVNHWSWSLEWYRKLFLNEELLSALWLSLQIAFITACVSTLIGTMSAFALFRHHFVGNSIIRFVNFLTLVLPELVLGICFLIWLVFLKFTLGIFSIILAHITFSISYVVITLLASLKNFDFNLEEAASDLGADRYQVFFKVTFPLIIPAILSSFLMSFTLSFDDFLLSFFTAGFNSDTLPLKLYSLVKFGLTPEINAMSTFVLVLTGFFIFLFFGLRSKRGW